MDQPADSLRPARQWLKNNLVTLGSAAVFTVYSAGYFRTREAADRFAGESVQRRAAALAPPGGHARSSVRTEAASGSSPGKPVTRPSSAAASAVADSRNATPPASAQTAATPPASEAPVAPAPADTQPAAAPAAAPAADSAALAADKKEEANELRDGVFYGWGTSRHGDIQAAVEIKSGRIVGAYVSQ